MLIAVIFFGFMAILAIARSQSKESARNLSRRFRSLGNMYGKSKDQIIERVGNPSAVSYMSQGQLLQWQRSGYHIAIRFDEDEMFAGITHEYAA